MDILWIKILTLCVLLGATLLLGVIPYKIIKLLEPSRSDRAKTLTSFASCFSGGVFLGVCFLHLLPHVRIDFENLLRLVEDEGKSPGFLAHYPLAEFIFVLGFFFVFLLEQSVLMYKDNDCVCKRGSHEYSSASNGDFDKRDEYRMEEAAIHNHDFVETTSILRSCLLVVALSVHSIFEGLAIGLQKSEKELWGILTAVFSHKLIMAFSLGMKVCQCGFKFSVFFIFIIVFSASSPLGIGIGAALSEMPESFERDLGMGILSAFAGGTFLYIVFFEIIPREMDKPGNRLWKVLFVSLGYIGMSGLMVMHEDE